MAFRYPSGKKYAASSASTISSTNKSFGNRGMSLEQDLNETNIYYQSTGQCVIHKKPTPVQIVNVDYPKRSAAKITEAYFKQPSTTDYNGIYRGKYIDFEAKETRNKTSFPFNNIHVHQAEHMKAVMKHEGIAFLIIRFSKHNQTYLYDASHFSWWYFEQSDRKSIPKDDIERDGHLIPEGYAPRLDYLSTIDKIYF
ncbi:Holliday junction resolvase RecU [Alteribacillus bidgolensis]|uniref:Holliday junction resolvase RecU n=1 Tax=Alteribacillus bidgolensis TaxID=930129 RepID=A0A1G8CAL9_9BACI|nr:Holliday junction resolvase RecU [Alteribacillus bidgolensis]SDH42313.1 recombination protein U [Alteribacillus bidgolensis]